MQVANSIAWGRVLEDIAHQLGDEEGGVRVACSVASLAKSLGVPRTTLLGWMDGSEPKHSDGERLLERWRALTGKPREFAPLERRSMSAARS